MPQQTDYAALAAKFGGTPDYGALARQYGGSSTPDSATPVRAPRVDVWGALKTAVPLADPDLYIGAGKGLANTAIGLGKYVRQAGSALGVAEPADEAFTAARDLVAPTSPAEKVGFAAEQAAEFVALPGPAKVKGTLRAIEAAKAGSASAGLALAQGASGGGAMVAGVLGSVPVAEGVAAFGEWAGKKAPAAIRSALKPTVASLKKIAGSAKEGIDAKAEQLMRWILENRVTTPEKARTIFQQAEFELQRVLSVKNAPTDEPTRAMRYLAALERSASKQRLPASDVANIRNAAAEVLEGSLGKDVITMVPKPHPTLVNASGKPITVLVPEKTRVLRDDTPANEALAAARSSSRWQTNKSWGELQGTAKEARKAVERAGRDAVKVAVPEAKPLLKRESMAIQAEKVLDRARQRAANRDQISLPAYVVGAGEIAAGKMPVLALAANWLRNNQLKAGVYADALSKAIAKGDTGRVVSILHRFGVGVTPQLTGSRP